MTVKVTHVEEAWNRIEGWCRLHAPEALDAVGPPLDLAARQAIERELGADLPDDFRQWLAQRSSAGYHGPFPTELPPPDACLGTWRMRNGLFPRGHESDGLVTGSHRHPAVQPVWWSPSWYPFTSDGAGNSLCIDLGPTRAGTRGQVIEFVHDHEDRHLVASSFTAWLEARATDLETGVVVATDYGPPGGFAGLLRRASLKGELVTLHVRGETDEQRRLRVAEHYATTPGAEMAPLLGALRGEGKLRGDRLSALMAVARVSEATPVVAKASDVARAVWKALRAADGVELSATPFDIQRILGEIRSGKGG